jgi:hypothetical protein
MDQPADAGRTLRQSRQDAATHASARYFAGKSRRSPRVEWMDDAACQNKRPEEGAAAGQSVLMTLQHLKQHSSVSSTLSASPCNQSIRPLPDRAVAAAMLAAYHAARPLTASAMLHASREPWDCQPGALAPHDYRHHAALATRPGRPCWEPAQQQASPCLISATQSSAAENLLSRKTLAKR